MHSKLIKHITDAINSNIPVSIILDSTTDMKGSHHLIVYFRTLEVDQVSENPGACQETPRVYFYKLIPIGMDETANGYFETLSNSIKGIEPGAENSQYSSPEHEMNLYDVLKTKLRGFSSDGASVMLGKKNGLAKIIQERFATHKVFTIHCMAHRLQLAIGNTVVFSYFNF
ncbi:MAG: hypothetical protein JO131_10245 [Gammaproteobacteria bacterium]|nr:hypothetical protein [Gammaproteobacteria bacterium]